MSEKERKKLEQDVAFGVMGYQRWRRDCMHAAEGRTFWNPNTSTRHRWLDDIGPLAEPWSPTTDPAAAMEVMKKCAEKCTVTAECDASKAQWLVAKLEDEWRGYGVVEANCKVAPTLELAICLFAKQLFSQPNHGGGK